jgi:hypothetical protein
VNVSLGFCTYSPRRAVHGNELRDTKGRSVRTLLPVSCPTMETAI